MASAGVLFSTSLRSAIARSNLRRCPSKTPSFSRSWSVRSGRTLRSIPFSLKRRAYCPRPSFSSQSAICRIAVPQAVSPQPEIVFFFDPDDGEPTPLGRLAYPGRPRRVDRSGLETYGNLWRWNRGNVWMLIKAASARTSGRPWFRLAGKRRRVSIHRMSVPGQTEKSGCSTRRSASPRIADIPRNHRHVSKVPRIGIGGSLAAPPLPHHRTYGFVYGGSRSYANALRSNDSTRCLDTPKHGIYSFPLVVPVRSHLLECSFHFLSPSACAVLARHRAMGRKYLSLLISSPSAPSLTSGLIASEAGREYRGVDTNYQCGATCASTVRRIGSDGKQGSPARCRLRGRARRAGRAARGGAEQFGCDDDTMDVGALLSRSREWRSHPFARLIEMPSWSAFLRIVAVGRPIRLAMVSNDRDAAASLIS